MKNGVRILLITVAFFVVLLMHQSVSAQCAMCSTTVESSNASGDKATNGLNNGILYLLSAPYIAVGVLGYVWYKKYRRKDVELNMRDEKFNLN